MHSNIGFVMGTSTFGHSLSEGGGYPTYLRCPTWSHWNCAHACWSPKYWHLRHGHGQLFISLLRSYSNFTRTNKIALDASSDTTIQMLLRKNGINLWYFLLLLYDLNCVKVLLSWFFAMHKYLLVRYCVMIWCLSLAGAAATPMRRPLAAPTPPLRTTSSGSGNTSTQFQPTYGKTYVLEFYALFKELALYLSSRVIPKIIILFFYFYNSLLYFCHCILQNPRGLCRNTLWPPRSPPT